MKFRSGSEFPTNNYLVLYSIPKIQHVVMKANTPTLIPTESEVLRIDQIRGHISEPTPFILSTSDSRPIVLDDEIPDMVHAETEVR